MSARPAAPPLVVHVVYRFDTGGLENGIVNLINHMPAAAYRHAVVALTEATDFRHRIHRADVPVLALHKPPGHGARVYPPLFRLLRQWRPAIVHGRNLAALEMAPAAWAAGVPVRVHGEHGRDVGDLDGSSRRYRLVRRLYRPFVSQWVALGRELTHYLQAGVGVPADRVACIYNGVDTDRFDGGNVDGGNVDGGDGRRPIAGCPFSGGAGQWLLGTVGRMAPVKHPLLLARAFVRAVELAPALGPTLRLVMVGDGPLRGAAQAVVDAAGLTAQAWLPGERGDVPEVMRGLDCFVLPSLAEGISNTILEAMASGLAVIATAVGANAELVVAGETGELVPSDDVDAMAGAIVRMAADPPRCRALGAAGRRRVAAQFSLRAMVANYQSLYDRLLPNHPSVHSPAHAPDRRNA